MWEKACTSVLRVGDVVQQAAVPVRGVDSSERSAAALVGVSEAKLMIRGIACPTFSNGKCGEGSENAGLGGFLGIQRAESCGTSKRRRRRAVF